MLENIDCRYSSEPPRRGGSNEYPQSMVYAEILKNIGVFLSENFQFLEVKFSIYLNRRVFVMIYWPFQSDSSVAVLPFSSVEAFIMLRLFWRCLFLISSFGAREDCFVTVVFPGCLH